MKKTFLIAMGIILAIGAVRLLVPPQPMFPPEARDPQNAIFASPTKSSHLVSNTPQHASVFAAPPINVVIDVDLEVTGLSEISIRKDNKDYGIGATLVDKGKLTMRRNMDPTALDGIYTVIYKPCWQDGECSKGSFEYAIDRRLAGDFEDHLGRPDIPPDIGVSIENNAFVPKKLRIRKNTRVVWTNNDTVHHTVTTDGSYFPLQNSGVLKPKEAFELVFSDVGEYPYHSISAPETMTGSLLVED